MGRPAKAKKEVDENFDDNVDMTKKKQAPPAMGGNIQGVYDRAKSSKEKIDQWKKERKAINDLIKAERESMEAIGLTKDAFDDAMAYVNSSPDKREGYDTAYLICREAFGAPVKGAQAELNFGNAVTSEGDDDEQETD